MNTLHHQWFSDRYLKKSAYITLELMHELVDAHGGSLVERILCVAIRAADIAVRQSHKHTWPPHMARLALYAVEDFVDYKMGHDDGIRD